MVYDTEAAEQFDYLAALDTRYIDEPEKYEMLLAALPETIGIEMGFEGKPYYVFVTKQIPGGPVPLWISYVIEPEKHQVRIIDIRQHPRDRRQSKQ